MIHQTKTRDGSRLHGASQFRGAILRRVRRVLFAAAIGIAALWAPILGARAEPIQIVSTPLAAGGSLEAKPYDIPDSAVRYLGGIELKSDDKRFGGWSGLVIEGGDRLVAISDRGHWLIARLDFDEVGNLKGLTDAQIHPFLGDEFDVLRSKSLQDAESIAVSKDGYFVSFERRHRIRAYTGIDGAGIILTPLPGLADARGNSGLEALTELGDGRFLALQEDMAKGQTGVEAGYRGWIFQGAESWPVTIAGNERLHPTGLTRLPNGDLLLLERRFALLTGFGARFRRIARDQIKPGARIKPTLVARLASPVPVDNLEGVAAVPAKDGQVKIFVISDDNFSAFQRTLLLVFEYRPAQNGEQND